MPGSHLTRAVRYCSIKVLRTLIDHGAYASQSAALQVAVEANRVEVLPVLLEYDAEVNQRLDVPLDRKLLFRADEEGLHNRDSECPLHAAVRTRNYDALRWLLENGTDVDIRDCYWYTAYDWA